MAFGINSCGDSDAVNAAADRLLAESNMQGFVELTTACESEAHPPEGPAEIPQPLSPDKLNKLFAHLTDRQWTEVAVLSNDDGPESTMRFMQGFDGSYRNAAPLTPDDAKAWVGNLVKQGLDPVQLVNLGSACVETLLPTTTQAVLDKNDQHYKQAYIAGLVAHPGNGTGGAQKHSQDIERLVDSMPAAERLSWFSELAQSKNPADGAVLAHIAMASKTDGHNAWWAKQTQTAPAYLREVLVIAQRADEPVRKQFFNSLASEINRVAYHDGLKHVDLHSFDALTQDFVLKGLASADQNESTEAMPWEGGHALAHVVKQDPEWLLRDATDAILANGSDRQKVDFARGISLDWHGTPETYNAWLKAHSAEIVAVDTKVLSSVPDVVDKVWNDEDSNLRQATRVAVDFQRNLSKQPTQK